MFLKKLVQIQILVAIVSFKTQAQSICTPTTCRFGECEQLFNSFVCHCYGPNKGTRCDRLMESWDDPCLSNPCWNGGVCQSSGKTWSCICPVGFSGANCRTLSNNPCLEDDACKNNGICRPTPNAQGFQCICIGDWTGSKCETAIPLCSLPNACFNGAKCVNDKCECKPNFTGNRCETYVQPTTTKKD